MAPDDARFDEQLELREQRSGKEIFAAIATPILVALYAGRHTDGTSLALLAGAFMVLFFMRGLLTAKRSTVRLRIDDEGVLVARSTPRARTAPVRRIARAEIASGFYRPAGRGGYVILRDNGGNDLVEVAVHDEKQAVALLAALDLDAAKRLFSVDVASPITSASGRAGGVLLACLALGGLASASMFAGLSPMFALAAVTLAVLVGAWPAHAEIASDGVSIAWLTRRRFVPFAELVAVAETAKGAVLELVSGERVLVPRAVGEPGTDAMIARLREALEVHRSAGDAGAAAALVSCGDRDVSAWLDDLRGLRKDGYRTTAVREDDLWRVIEDPSARPDARAGAAMVLRPTLDDAGRARIRVTSGATASPRLRIALDAAVEEEEDDRVEEHLASLVRER